MSQTRKTQDQKLLGDPTTGPRHEDATLEVVAIQMLAYARSCRLWRTVLCD
jgi:hypothetical protein